MGTAALTVGYIIFTTTSAVGYLIFTTALVVGYLVFTTVPGVGYRILTTSPAVGSVVTIQWIYSQYEVPVLQQLPSSHLTRDMCIFGSNRHRPDLGWGGGQSPSP